MLSTDQILKGLGLVIVLALGLSFASRQLRLPTIVLLFPACGWGRAARRVAGRQLTIVTAGSKSVRAADAATIGLGRR